MKDFDDFVSLLNEDETYKAEISKFTSDILKNPENVADLYAKMIQASTQQSLNVLRLYHKWISEK